MDPEAVSYSDIEQAKEWAEWTVKKVKFTRPALKEGDALTVALLEKKMESLLVQTPQPFKREHRRKISAAISPALTTMDLIRKKADQKGVSPKVVPVDLRRGLSEDETRNAVERFQELHHGLVTFAASAYKGKGSIPEELPGESLEK